MSEREAERKPRIWQSAVVLGVMALAIYGGFILLVHMRGGL